MPGERRTENGNGHRTNAVRLMIPITAVGMFVAFGVGAGQYIRSMESERALDRMRMTALEHQVEQLQDQKLDKRDMQGWVREYQANPARIPEAPR